MSKKHRSKRAPGRGLSLLEVVLGLACLLVVLLPVIQLTVSGRAETVAARDHLLAMGVANALLADLRASGRRVAGTEEVALEDLPMFKGILEAHRENSPEGYPAVEPVLASFRTRVRSGTGGIQVTIDWTNAGQPRTLTVGGACP